jgi:RNA polymerase sigma factor (sigma-70 family)
MEPNPPDGCVPDVDFTIDAANPPGTPGSVARTADVGDVDDAVQTRFASFEDFYLGSRASVGRALALTLRDDDLAREAIDEAMARAYQRWSHVGQLDNPGGWVYRVGLNWSRSVIRRMRRNPPIWIAQPGDAPAAAPADPSIDAALDTLSVDHRAVVVCRLLLGLSELQTADVLGLRPGTVKSRLARALDRLQPLLAPLLTPPEENR